MSSIRPLFTIAVLVAVFGYLYVKINQGPVQPQDGAKGITTPMPDGVPPLAAAPGGAKLDQDTSAPAWPQSSADAPAAPILPPGVGTPAPAATPGSAAADAASVDATVDKNGVPSVPPIPELPELPKTADAATPNALPATPPIETPVALPVMPLNSTTDATPTPPTTPPAAVDAGATTPIGGPEITTPPASTPATTADAAVPLVNPAPAANITPIPNSPVTSIPSPINAPPPAAANSAAADDRYGIGADTSTAPTTVTPLAATPPATSPLTTPAAAPPAALGPAASASAFAASWPAIQTALEHNDLKQAHQLLTKWHNNETLTPEESQKVEGLLGQLAGTVIYSNEHRLEPARIVKPGESLEAIAKEYNVPWQLLAKINSIAAPDQVRPGQELKVVRGPFTAVLDVRRNELTLEVDGRYAGTFPVTIPPGAPVADGQWVVENKQDRVAPPTAAVTAGTTEATRAIILRSASASGPQAPTLVIASGVASAPNAGAATIQVGPQDAEDLSDILSIGSRVVVRR
ncbi:MAG: LysM peptidoglycan-binding domain-containing protein [Pirellulales bacterium]